MKQKLVIIWWTWDFSSWVASFLNVHFWNKLDIYITWKDKEISKEVSEKIWVKYYEDNIEAVKNSNIVVFWVSINNTCDVIKEVWPHIKAWSIVFDITSIKKWPSEFLKKYVSKDCLIIPTHPMFWPWLSSIAGQIFVLTPEKEAFDDYRYVIFKATLENLWARILETTPEDHDKMMAVVQWLTHYSMFVIWKTIKKYWVDVLKTLDFVSPIYKLMIASVSRYIGHSPELYADIQMNNDEILWIHKLFNETSNEFNKIVKEKDKEKFVEMVLQTREFFWEKNCQFWQRYTDKIIYFLAKEQEKLKSNIWKEIVLENIYSKIKKSWVLKSFDSHNIVLWDWEIIDVNEWYII